MINPQEIFDNQENQSKDINKNLFVTKKESELEEYLKTGNSNPLTLKYFSNEKDLGGVLLDGCIQNKITQAINTLSPIRNIASVTKITNNSLDVILSEGQIEGSWINSIEERRESNTNKLKIQKIYAHELYAQPKATQALINDSVINLEEWISQKLSHIFAKLENDAFINGDGKNSSNRILKYQEQIESDEVKLLSIIQGIKDNSGRLIWQNNISNKLEPTIFGIPVITCSEIGNIKWLYFIS